MYDAIIIGTRCAGSPTAMFLARKGYRVLLLERCAFPSDTYRSHFIQHPGVVQLHRWGLLDRVAASNCPPISVFGTDFGDFPLAMPVESGDGHPCRRRSSRSAPPSAPNTLFAVPALPMRNRPSFLPSTSCEAAD